MNACCMRVLLLQMSAEMMKNMSKEDLAKMQAMAGASRTSGAAGPMQSGTGMGIAPPSSMSEMLKNPEAMKQAMHMMKSMDKDGLKNMLKMSQPGKMLPATVRFCSSRTSAFFRFLSFCNGPALLSEAVGVTATVCSPRRYVDDAL
jgi:hypothetical protein